MSACSNGPGNGQNGPGAMGGVTSASGGAAGSSSSGGKGVTVSATSAGGASSIDSTVAQGGTASAGGTGGGTASTGGTGGQLPDAGGRSNSSGGATAPGNTQSTHAGAPADASVEADAGECAEFVMPADCEVPSGAVLPAELRCTGLYSDWPGRTLRCGVEPYEPAYQLWSDGAGKQRYVWLPPGEKIDVKAPDDFVFPVGTRFWKEFYVGPPGSQRLGETRYLLKVKGGWLYTTYIWSADGTRAIQNNDGVEDLFGSGHVVPTREQCKTCHTGRRDFILGWDFIMLGAGASGATARVLADRGLLDKLDPTLLELSIPGDAVERSALGYLHANCGVSCHNETTNATGKPSGLFLRLESAEMGQVMTTDAARSGINRLPSPNADYGDVARVDAGDYYDFRPLDAERSLSLARMAYRGSITAMPPIASHRVHEEGVAIVKAWVESMTQARGYPAPAP